MPKSSSRQRMQQVAWLIGIVLCAAMAYAGWQFIQMAEQGVAGIQNNTAVASEPWASSEPESIASDVFAASEPMDDTQMSEGQDIVVQEGELRYQDGVPQLRLRVQNQGRFRIGRLYVRVKMLPQTGQDVLAQTMLKMLFKTPLSMGDKTLISLPISDEKWQEISTQNTSPKRVWVQVLSVGNADIDGADYPQTSPAIQISEIPAEPAPIQDDADDADHSVDNPNHHNPIHSEPPEDAVEQILRQERESATGEPRILSFEVQQSKQPAPRDK